MKHCHAAVWLLLLSMAVSLFCFDVCWQAYTEAMPIHPLFMDEEDFKNPEMVDNNPALEAINQMIESATPRERAVQSKEDGNQYFKIGQKDTSKAKRDDNYQLALSAYKKAGAFCNDHIKELGHKGSKELVAALELKSTCHTNSAVVHMAMNNLQKAISECKIAIKIYPGNMKVGRQTTPSSIVEDRFRLPNLTLLLSVVLC